MDVACVEAPLFWVEEEDEALLVMSESSVVAILTYGEDSRILCEI